VLLPKGIILVGRRELLKRGIRLMRKEDFDFEACRKHKKV